MKVDKWKLVRGARQLVTLRRHGGVRRGDELGELGVIADGSVLLRNDVIEAVGTTRQIENMADARHADAIDASGRVVMPAFVDSHACLITLPSRRLDGDGNVSRSAAAKSVAARPANRLEAQADELLRTMARHGTGTAAALSGYGFDSTGELKILRALRALDKKPLDLAPVLSILNVASADNAGGDEHRPLWAGEDLLDCVARRKLANIASVRCEKGGISPAAAELFLIAAQSRGFAVRMEMSTAPEAGLVQKAVDLNALSITTAERFRSHEIELLSQSSTFAILLPALAAKTGASGFARELVENGVRIALGSGLGPEAAATASMQTAVQLACEVLGLSLAEAISAATINAAWALGMGSEVGSLEHGKRADLILLNASDYREIPLLAGTNLTHSMMKRGVLLFEEEFKGWPAENRS